MTRLTRRNFFASTGAAALTIGATSRATASTPQGDLRYDRTASTMDFEVQRTDEEWRAMLTDYEYAIMREGRTETPKKGTLWNETAKGTYFCKGCDLPVYTSNQKVVKDIGFVFFYHAEPDSVLMAVEGNAPAEYGEPGAATAGMVEVHCRACSSHLGHFLIIDDVMTHCINDTALKFEQAFA